MTDKSPNPDESRRALAERRGIETEVYEPAEDSYLLATAAAAGVEPGWLVLDVGTGSGYVAEHVVTEAGARVVAADVNPHACRRARERFRSGNVVGIVRADLVGPFRDGAFDAVLFNPPYLPTPEGIEWDDWMERALSGGETGRAVVGRFLREVPRVLAPGGIVFLLVSSLTGVEAVRELAAEAGFDAAVVAEETFPYERLVVLRLAAE